MGEPNACGIMPVTSTQLPFTSHGAPEPAWQISNYQNFFCLKLLTEIFTKFQKINRRITLKKRAKRLKLLTDNFTGMFGERHYFI